MIKCIFLSFFLYFSQTTEKYQVEINSTLTKPMLQSLVTKAKEQGLTIKILYESYDSNGKLKTAQFKASIPNVGEGQSTFSADANDCMIIFKDLSPNSKSTFGFKSCKRQ